MLFINHYAPIAVNITANCILSVLLRPIYTKSIVCLQNSTER